MGVSAEIIRLIEARIAQLTGERIKHRLNENNVALSVSANTKVLSVEWQQSRYSDVEVNVTVTGQASQAGVLTGTWQLDGSTVLAPVTQQASGYCTLAVSELLHAVAPGNHKLDFYLTCSAGTFAVNAFGAKMYIASTAIAGNEMQPKITIAEHWTNISIAFNPVINLRAMTESLTPTLDVWTPVPVSINEHWTNISIEFTPPTIGLRAMMENVTLKIT